LSSLADPVAEADRIMKAAEERKIVLRLFGGTSFYFRCPSAKHRSLQRSYVDIDFMGHLKQSRDIKKLFIDLGYKGRDMFNQLQGHKRLIFNDLEKQRRVDIFLDVFEMCHKFNFKDRLDKEQVTIPLADMLVTKLQIVEMSGKDLKDILSILIDYDVGESDGGMINGAYIAKMCGDDWGVYKTFVINLDRLLTMLPETDLEAAESSVVKVRLERLKNMIEGAPKSLRWKMRATVGEKVAWYILPESDKEVVDSRAMSAN
jgi:hypothetical protein